MARLLCVPDTSQASILPFTPTHTLAAVPLGWWFRKPAVFSSIVIGSLVPDWPLYVPFGPAYDLTHSMSGLILACLPLGLALAMFYQFALKRPLYDLLPVYFRKRLAPQIEQPDRFTMTTISLIIVAVVLGAASHIAWDSFTHRDMWGVRAFPALNEGRIALGPLRLRPYMALQHGSTFIGLPVFLLLLVYWCKITPVHAALAPSLPRRAIIFWRAVLLGIPLAMTIKTSWELYDADSPRHVFRALYIGVTQAGLMFLIAFAILGGGFLLLYARKTD